jgi:hypothetical protein
MTTRYPNATLALVFLLFAVADTVADFLALL